MGAFLMALTEDQYRQRERTIPPQLIELARGQTKNPWDVPTLSAAVALAVLNKYMVGDTDDLAEMQVELILALAARCDELEKQLRDLALRNPPAWHLLLPQG
jgi:hypothetical protein